MPAAGGIRCSTIACCARAASASQCCMAACGVAVAGIPIHDGAAAPARLRTPATRRRAHRVHQRGGRAAHEGWDRAHAAPLSVFRRVLAGTAIITAAFTASYGLFNAATPHALIIAALFVGGFFPLAAIYQPWQRWLMPICPTRRWAAPAPLPAWRRNSPRAWAPASPVLLVHGLMLVSGAGATRRVGNPARLSDHGNSGAGGGGPAFWACALTMARPPCLDFSVLNKVMRNSEVNRVVFASHKTNFPRCDRLSSV